MGRPPSPGPFFHPGHGSAPVTGPLLYIFILLFSLADHRWATFYVVIAALLTTGFALIPISIVTGRIWYRKRFPLVDEPEDKKEEGQIARGSGSSIGGSSSATKDKTEFLPMKARSYSAVVSSGDSLEAAAQPELPPRNRPEASGFRNFPSKIPDGYNPRSPYVPTKISVRPLNDSNSGPYSPRAQQLYLDAYRREASLADGMVPSLPRDNKSRLSHRSSTPFPSGRSSRSRVRTCPAETPTHNPVGIRPSFMNS